MKTTVSKVNKSKAPTHKHPPYSELGPVWTVYPVERCEELGTTTNYLVADLDFDPKSLTGNFIAECGSWHNAFDIADALNAVNAAKTTLPVLRELFDIAMRVPVFAAFPKVPDFSGERDRFMAAMVAAEEVVKQSA